MTMIISTVVVSKDHLPNLELTNEHLDSSKIYINPKKYPDRYLPKDLEKGIKFLARELISLNQMVMPTDHNQHTNTGQIARTSTAANAEQTEFSIVKNGLALKSKILCEVTTEETLSYATKTKGNWHLI